MLKKNIQIGQTIGRKEMKNLKGGYDPCRPRILRSCNYSFSTAAACSDWAYGTGADSFTFNTSNCYCCAITYVEYSGPDCLMPV
jgi:hypothetical protein